MSLYTCKKGSRTQYKNYRGVTLLSVLGKVYATVLDKRIRAITEEKVLEEQGAFRRKRSCIDQIFTETTGGEGNREEQNNEDGMCRPRESF